jgi:splicing factor U2AF subunit
MIGATMSSANFGAMNSERMSMIAGNAAMLNSGSAAGKALRRIYVGNLPPMTMEEHLKVFFSDVMKVCIELIRIESALSSHITFLSGISFFQSACSNIDPGEPVVMVYINHEKKFAFVEFRTIEEAAAAMDLDGINFKYIFA